MQYHFVLSAKVLMLATTVLSTAVSLVGGLVMYLEGLRIIESTIKEISSVALLSTADKLNASLAETHETSLAYATLLTTWDGLSTPEEWLRFLQADQFGRVKTSVGLYGVGVYVVPLANTVANSGGFAQIVWWDPLADGTRDWLSGFYLPRNWGICANPSRNDTLKHRCLVGNSLDPVNGTVVSFAYQWSSRLFNELSSGGDWEKQQIGWEVNGTVWWRRAQVWFSKDNTPYVFGTLMRTVPKQPSGHPIWGEGYKLVISTHNIFNHWEDLLRHTDGQSSLVATFLHAGLDSQALATNADAPLLEKCAMRTAPTGMSPCVITLKQLPPHIQEACIKASKTEAGHFFRSSIGGSEYWVMRRVILETREDFDAMPSINLVWLRRVSTVEDQLNRALFFLVGFATAVFVFDVCVLVVELRHIALPLERLEWAMQPVDQMDLTESSARLQCVGAGRCFDVAEVSRLLGRFQLTLDSLTTYKAFLPQSCLHRPDVGDDDASGAGAGCTTASGESLPPTMASVLTTNPSDGCASPLGPGRDRTRSSVMGRGAQLFLAQLPCSGAQTAEPRHTTVSLLAANTRGLLTSEAFCCSPSSAAGVIGDGVDRFTAAVQRWRGTVDLLSGDHQFASFGAAHRCTGHRTAALSCAWVLRSEHHGLLSSAAVCCGEVLCGDFGSYATMRFMVIGGLACALLALERVASQRAIEVLIDHRVQQDAVRWSCCLIDRVMHPKRRTTPFCVWSVMGRLRADERQEWMYVLTASQDPYERHNTALMHFLKGELGAARAALAELPAPPRPEESQVARRALPTPGTESPNSPASSVRLYAVAQAIQELGRRLEAGDCEEGCERYSLVQECTQLLVRKDHRFASAPDEVTPAAVALAASDPLFSR